MTSEEWMGRLQTELEVLIDSAPDQWCKAFAQALWDQTAEVDMPDDEPPEAA